jgi:two-component system cell cycle response regulator
VVLSNWFDIGLFFLLFALFVYLFASVTITNLHKVYFMFHFSIMLWPFCQFIIQTTTNPTFQLLYVSIAFTGLSLLGFGLLVFTIFLTGQSVLLRRKIFLMLFVPTILTALSVIINPGAFVIPLNGGYVQRTYGSLFWLMITVLLGYFFVSLYLMFRTLATNKLHHIRNRVRLALIGFLVLIGFSLADLFVNVVLSPKYPITGLTSLGIFLCDICIIIAIRHYNVFDIVTIAHQDIIDTISYGILVLDENEVVVEINRALYPFSDMQLGDHFDVEANLSKFTPASEVNLFLQAYRKHQSGRVQIELKQDESDTRNVIVHTAPIIMSGGVIIGRIITFQDVSQLHRLVEEKNRQNQILYEHNHSLITIQDELFQVNQKLEHAAITDSLTGCYNRGYLTQKLEHEMILNARNRIPFAIYLLDIDFFKSINDRYGHLVGDEVICSTVEAIKHTLRRTDILVRYGGEEFLIYLPHINRVQAEILAERVKTTIEMNKVIAENGAHTLSITISMGVLSIDDSNDEIPENPKAYLNQLFASVDGSLYQAKMEGRNRIVSTAR